MKIIHILQKNLQLPIAITAFRHFLNERDITAQPLAFSWQLCSEDSCLGSSTGHGWSISSSCITNHLMYLMWLTTCNITWWLPNVLQYHTDCILLPRLAYPPAVDGHFLSTPWWSIVDIQPISYNTVLSMRSLLALGEWVGAPVGCQSCNFCQPNSKLRETPWPQAEPTKPTDSLGKALVALADRHSSPPNVAMEPSHSQPATMTF